MPVNKVKTGAGHTKAQRLNAETRKLSQKGLMSKRAIRELQAENEREHISRLNSMDEAERKELEFLRDLHCPVVRNKDVSNDDWENIGDVNQMDLDDVLSGKAGVDISHGGGEFCDILEGYLQKNNRSVCSPTR